MFGKKAGQFVWKGAILIVACTVSAALGSGFGRHLGVSTYTISYADFVSIMLTACSVLLAAVAIIIAVMAVLGWTAISNGVRTRTEQFLDHGFQHGNPLYAMVEAKVTQIMFEGVSPVEADPEADDIAAGGGGEHE